MDLYSDSLQLSVKVKAKSPHFPPFPFGRADSPFFSRPHSPDVRASSPSPHVPPLSEEEPIPRHLAFPTSPGGRAGSPSPRDPPSPGERASIPITLCFHPLLAEDLVPPLLMIPPLFTLFTQSNQKGREWLPGKLLIITPNKESLPALKC